MQGKIEQTNIPISGDASERMFQFLEQVNFELARRGVKEAFSITSEIENALLEELKQLGKTTKITIDEIEKVLEKFGTPSQIATNYGAPPELQTQSLKTKSRSSTAHESGLKIEPDARILPRRKIDGEFTIKEILFTNLEQGFALLPLFVLISTILTTTNYLGSKYYNGDPNLPVLPVIIFIVFELYSGIMGRTGFKYSTAVKLRDCFRLTVFGMTLALIWSIMNIQRMGWEQEQFIGLLSYWIFSLLLVEGMVFLRDHMVGLAPLKPEFPKFTRRSIVQWGILAIGLLFMFLPGLENVLKVVIGIPFIFINLLVHFLLDRRSLSFGFVYATFLTLAFTLLTIISIFS